MLLGRLGLETARLPHVDRHGLVLLDRGALTVEDGCLRFVSAGGGAVERGQYTIPHQSISLVLLGPGSTVSHDALRLLARHGVGLAAVGDDGVRLHTAPPLMPDFSNLARRQVELWADDKRGRLDVARRMYAWRLGEILPHRDIAVLRGIEGARVKALYATLSERYGIEWRGRHYDRTDPAASDLPNQAINHAASAVEAAAAIAVTATATIPQLGFIHEDSGQSFVLDMADLFRDSITVPTAFKAVAAAKKARDMNIERLTRRMVGETLRRQTVIASMINRIKELFPPGDFDSDAPRRPRKATPADLSGLEADSERSVGNADDDCGDS
jgi:CRISPR-associated protein Cas1